MPAPSLLSNRNMRRLGQDPTTHFKNEYDEDLPNPKAVER